MMGCGFAEGESGYNVGRNATLLAGIDHHVPGTTVNRFCASSLQTTRMAFHAIKAGEGDTYVAAGVEAVSRAGQGAPFEFHPKLDGSESSALQRLHPDGHDRRERRRALQGQPRGAGRVGRHLPDTRRRRPGVRPLRQRDRPGDRAGAHRHRQGGQRDRGARAGRHEGRRSARRHHDGEALRAEAGVQRGRHGDSRATPAR